MIDTSLMYDLLKATNKASKLVFVGDHNQLYPVGYGEPFFQFMDVMEIYRLKQNHRQSEDTDILYMANRALQNLPVMNGSGVSVNEIEYSDIPKVLDWYLCGNGYDENSQVISPFNTTNSDINTYVQEQNARKNGFLKQDEQYSEGKLYVDDKIMTVRNTEHYCNGDIGYVSAVNEKEITVQIEGRQVVIPAKDKDDIQLAYAITVHKMQGSEADRIIVFLPRENRMVEKRMLYTAFTRAKKELLIYYY
jgi:exodeoxyribonuclease V alpha subunit